ncbi:type I glyceraldehyde-3-phosphate dehydrogenase [Mangrovimonas sp. AS39]|uniref:type I glyceraldehyde-3-phosphate dehydrogenase n=1 Tax=Mangrovimonas futianensis TaxID=2895523 RepID=UPI001E4CFEA6|nr:type I glyceraldehyde-3-phosphate dehydrogenase [Mangrovimonas futianensis]MCF1190709.1 type I glyceraldehyde-3-phosphate dehydrogenase [Mangrovimonas futianensis]MCF1194406.1 type I glyceraldehyde-3-phosphate dehydrogenase [Mangrovimonas futianensis]
MIRIGINGFGRIGRRVFRLALERPDIEVVAINDLADVQTLSHLLKYDSIHGVLKQHVSYSEGFINVDDLKVAILNHTHPKDIDWSAFKLDFLIESTGKFKDRESLHYHIKNGAKQVILSVPPLEDDIKTIVLGVNDHILNGQELIISNASCTTNNAAPMISIIKDLCGIDQAYITTVHSYTTDQSLHDQPHKDLRRARAAGQSIVPTTTGAAKALTKIFPDLNDVIGGCGIRVPVANGSLTDITFNVKRETSISEINNAFKTAAKNRLKGILEYTEDPIVSIDIVGNQHSCIFDAQMTSVIGNMVKIIGWYDNETGYSSRVLDLICNLSIKK